MFADVVPTIDSRCGTQPGVMSPMTVRGLSDCNQLQSATGGKLASDPANLCSHIMQDTRTKIIRAGGLPISLAGAILPLSVSQAVFAFFAREERRARGLAL